MSIDLAFTDEDWARIERDYMAWWGHDLTRPLVQITGVERDPRIAYRNLPRRVAAFPKRMSAEEILATVQPHLEATRYYGDAYPRWWLDFGPGIVAGFLGARVNVVPETVWFEPRERREARDLSFSHDPDNWWWRRIKSLTRTAVEAWEGRVQISHTDLGGNLDVIASFRATEGLLLDLYDTPEEIDRLVSEVTSLWCRYYDELDAIIRPACRGTTPWAPIWSRDTCYMLQCDFAYMISPEMFARFVMPDLVACCERLEHGFYHLDGPGQIAHVDQLLSIDRLRGIQWIPGDGNPPPEEWLDLLQRIVGGGRLCQLYVTPEGARTIVRNIGGTGFMFSISDPMTADEADAYLRLLSREDVGHA